MDKLGIIGAGNMGKAILSGVLAKGVFKKENVFVFDPYKEGLKKVEEDFGVNITDDPKEVVKNADAVLIAVKPHLFKGAMEPIKGDFDGKVLISIVAATSIADIESVVGDGVKIVRTMPNTPALVGEGMSAVCKNRKVTDEELDEVLKIYGAFGKAEVVEENMFDVVTGLSGSGPAYCFMFLEALADAAVAKGMPRAKAYKFAGQLLLGSAKMMLDTGKHPGELKDMVCSPGGTTIAAVEALEATGFRAAAMAAVKAATEKSIAMGKK